MTRPFVSTALLALALALAIASPALAQDGGVEALPAAHMPAVQLDVNPPDGVRTGELLNVVIQADAREGDDVTVPEQSFLPFELHARRVRVEPARDQRQRFVFELDLLALDAGEHELGPIELRVVTSEGVIGSTHTPARTLRVASRIANEPNAELKPATDTVTVMQDDYTLLYVLGALAAAALIVLLTLRTARWWRNRTRQPAPPPPPRPPLEIALEKLDTLLGRKTEMLAEGRGAEIVDGVSDVVREYLGAIFGFDGLETTTDEMIDALVHAGAKGELVRDVGQYLNRCDLVKFAKVVPDEAEIDTAFTRADQLIRENAPATPNERAA
jgi:hypothetical protein